MPEPWPFTDPLHTSVAAERAILDGAPIVVVVRDDLASWKVLDRRAPGSRAAPGNSGAETVLFMLDHKPRWWERIWLRMLLRFRRRAMPGAVDQAGGAGPSAGPDGPWPSWSGVPRRPPDAPRSGSVALQEPDESDTEVVERR